MLNRILVSSIAVLAGCLVFDHELPPSAVPECATHTECIDRLSGSTERTPAMCIQTPTPHCAKLTSPDCATVTGDYADDRAILIASLLTTTGAQASTNIPRQQAAILAVEQINATNASGGVLQSSTPGDARKLVMVSCDAAADLPRVTRHLVDDLHVTAIVGPNFSQDTIDMTLGDPARQLPSTAQAGIAMFSPTANAAAIATIPDNGLTYMMVPSDLQRTPLMKTQINALETQLKAARSKTSIKLAIYYRNDALGKGTRDGLVSLQLNGTTLATAISLGLARIDEFDPLSTNNTPLVNAYVAFQPDIVVVIGGSETIKYFVQPLEAAWLAAQPTVPRPYYLGADVTKIPDLITAVTGNEDLRVRVRGVGIVPTVESQSVFSAFQVAYGQRWKDANGNPQPANSAGMGPSFDAVYAIALALVGRADVSGATMAAGLPRLATNRQTCTYDTSGILAPCFTVTDSSRTLYNNMGLLLQNKPVTEIGTFGRIEWDAQGAKACGLIEVWCINATGPKPVFASSGLTFDVKTQTQAGSYTQCAP